MFTEAEKEAYWAAVEEVRNRWKSEHEGPIIPRDIIPDDNLILDVGEIVYLTVWHDIGFVFLKDGEQLMNCISRLIMRVDENRYKLYRGRYGSTEEAEYDEVYLYFEDEWGTCGRLNLLTGPGVFKGPETIVKVSNEAEWEFWNYGEDEPE